MKIKVSYRLADMVDELFKNGKLVIDDGFVSREIARTLSPLRKKGCLYMGPDRRFGKSLLIVAEVRKRKRVNKALFGTSIFEFEIF